MKAPQPNKWPFRKMKVDDCEVFYEPATDLKKATLAAHSYGRSKGWTFTAKRNGAMLRVWRLT